MDYGEVLNIDALIAPISDGSPVGFDPRSDISPSSRYYTLKDIRSQARANERASLVDDEDPQALSSEWHPVVEQVPVALAAESKDLEYVAWLIEALCRTEGFRGLAAGFKLARALIEKYWDSLYPLPDEDGLETRISPLVGLNGYEGEGSLITPIVSIPITDGNGEETFATWQYSRATDVARMDEDKRRQKADAGIASLEEIEAAVKASSPHFYISLVKDIQTAIDEFQALSEAMDVAMGGAPQPTSTILKSLNKCYDAVNYLAGDIIERFHAENTQTIPEQGEHGEEQIAADTTMSGLAKQLETRDQAIRMLEDVADYFRKTEPHSPMSYAIEQVVRWSGLGLPELLQELIEDGNSRTNYFRLTGIKEGE